jgi:hypothetical protein
MYANSYDVSHFDQFEYAFHYEDKRDEKGENLFNESRKVVDKKVPLARYDDCRKEEVPATDPEPERHACKAAPSKGKSAERIAQSTHSIASMQQSNLVKGSFEF